MGQFLPGLGDEVVLEASVSSKLKTYEDTQDDSNFFNDLMERNPYMQFKGRGLSAFCLGSTSNFAH